MILDNLPTSDNTGEEVFPESDQVKVTVSTERTEYTPAERVAISTEVSQKTPAELNGPSSAETRRYPLRIRRAPQRLNYT